MLVIQADQVHALAGREGGNGGGGGAGDDEGRVDLAVLQRFGAVTEGLVGGLDVVFGQAIGAENVDGVEVHTGTGGTDGDGLALQVGNGLDVRVQGDDLDLLHVERSHDGEAVDGADLFKGALTGIGIGQNVGLGEAQLRIADVNGINVGRGAAGGDGRDIGAGHIAHLLGQDTAEAVIGACFAAGGEGHLAAAVFRGNRVIRERRHAEGADHGNCEQNCEQFFHLCFLLYLAKLKFVRYDNTTNFIRMQE